MIDEIPIPNRLENRIHETEHEQILHGFLAQVVIDPKNLPLLERAMGGAVDSALVDVETKQLFDQEKARLSERDRQILVLIEQDCGSPRDVAEALGLTYAAAAKAIQRAKERVAEILSSTNVHRRGHIRAVDQ